MPEPFAFPKLYSLFLEKVIKHERKPFHILYLYYLKSYYTNLEYYSKNTPFFNPY